MQARPDLTWRDIQYLCIQTARLINPDDPDWERTAAGRPYSYKYGYGALDGYAFVTAAQQWESVKPQTWMKTRAVQVEGGTMDKDGKFAGGAFITEDGVSSTLDITQSDLDNHNLDQLEHINVKVWIGHSKRGDVGVELISPNGVSSVLASPRKGDVDKDGFPGWTFMSVKHWYVICYLVCLVLTVAQGGRTQLVHGLSKSRILKTHSLMEHLLAGV
jgi:kexin